MESPAIDSESLPAVQSLRSKFERMASETSNNINSIRPSSTSDHLALKPPPSPRPRATSSSQVVLSLPESTHLPTKRPPPPPPPPRGSKLAAPSPTPSASTSPLLRPVPIPPSVRDAVLIPPSVAVLQNRIVPTLPASPSRILSPAESSSSNTIFQLDAKPAVPPRPANLLPVPRTTASPEDTSETRLVPRSPFSDEGEGATIIPPTIPVRHQALAANVSNVEATSIRQLGAHFSDASQLSYDSDSQRSSRTNLVPPPRPPPRNRISISPNKYEHSYMSASLPVGKQTSPAPPLPVRRSTVQVTDIPPPSASGTPPHLPSRSQISPPNGNGSESPVTTERKTFGASKLPPPPTRTIALGDKLPPPRRSADPSSDEESGEEDEPKVQAIDMMPDGSASSRRPPTLSFREGFPDPQIHVHPHSGSVVLSGTHVITAHHHHVKVYNLAASEAPLFSLDTKDMGLKDTKVTCMEIRPTSTESDRGFLLWVGTKEGHIFEMDIRTTIVRAVKYSAHLHPITHVFRYARSMITLDESGKALIFSPDQATQEDVSLLSTVPRVVRTTDKQDFTKMLDGKLWTAARTEHHGVTPGQRTPVIRIYDIFNPANTGRSLLPSDHVGPVTSAAMLPSQPRMVFIGHEEGYISMWELDTEDGYPLCIEVVKVSTSDVLSLEGVNNRLWAGSRNGMISAYDVSQRPWVVTNCWNAHPGLPVMRLLVDHYGVVKVGKLCVGSVGRDEQLRLWDGLLGLDWIDKELEKKETSFSSFRDLTVLITTWNCDSARPDSLATGHNASFFDDVLHSVEQAPDVIVFGFQEVIDLESRRMTAKHVLLGVTGAYRRWYDRLVLAVRLAMPKELTYTVVHTENLVGLFSCVFVKSEERAVFDDVAGGIVARFVIGDSSICFINCHLAAGQNAVRRRNADIAAILEDKSVFPPADRPLAYVGGGDGSMILDHEFVFLNGDLNYRIDHRRDAIIAGVHAGDLNALLQHDQLLREIRFNRGCRLRGFSEGPITFKPTYKYDPFSDEYDSSEKRRSPAWCDRVLWRTRVATRVRQVSYRRYEVNVSDHRPVSAAFEVRVKNFDRERREGEQAILQAEWMEESQRLLNAVAKFYVEQALI
ncbi:Endonuclease/exonuclease/phosphatase [Gymnopilus junonius]|uniref:Endonuclease/exonuclease/phosphatase n=1 Tax=Gymnopilus junonius TaxID=109634 RepID=A0A9P5NUF8_GYMJU|nr:Endonuclease/exonuclease/phosphatase [Gymnopilus junonius]